MAPAAHHDISACERRQADRGDLGWVFASEEQHVGIWTQENRVLHRNDPAVQSRHNSPLNPQAFTAADDEAPLT